MWRYVLCACMLCECTLCACMLCDGTLCAVCCMTVRSLCCMLYDGSPVCYVTVRCVLVCCVTVRCVCCMLCDGTLCVLYAVWRYAVCAVCCMTARLLCLYAVWRYAVCAVCCMTARLYAMWQYAVCAACCMTVRCVCCMLYDSTPVCYVTVRCVCCMLYDGTLCVLYAVWWYAVCACQADGHWLQAGHGGGRPVAATAQRSDRAPGAHLWTAVGAGTEKMWPGQQVTLSQVTSSRRTASFWRRALCRQSCLALVYLWHSKMIFKNVSCLTWNHCRLYLIGVYSDDTIGCP